MDRQANSSILPKTFVLSGYNKTDVHPLVTVSPADVKQFFNYVVATNTTIHVVRKFLHA